VAPVSTTGAALATTLAAALLAGCAGPTDRATAAPPPDAGLVAAGCRWERVAGGGLEVRAQACDLATGRWRVVWEPQRQGFVLRVDEQVQELVVQPWSLPPGGGPGSIVPMLKAAGHLPAASDCQLVPARLRPLPRLTTSFILSPAQPVPAVTPSGDIPEPPCGAYGASTHGVRYFVFDLRWPDRLIFVDEGQDQPMFDPSSIVGR
jgi:hypothetical protein